MSTLAEVFKHQYMASVESHTYNSKMLEHAQYVHGIEKDSKNVTFWSDVHKKTAGVYLELSEIGRMADDVSDEEMTGLYEAGRRAGIEKFTTFLNELLYTHRYSVHPSTVYEKFPFAVIDIVDHSIFDLYTDRWIAEQVAARLNQPKRRVVEVDEIEEMIMQHQ